MQKKAKNSFTFVRRGHTPDIKGENLERNHRIWITETGNRQESAKRNGVGLGKLKKRVVEKGLTGLEKAKKQTQMRREKRVASQRGEPEHDDLWSRVTDRCRQL